MDRQSLAEACAAAMAKGDEAAKRLGVEILEVRPGYARLSLRVRADMLNGVGTCHGGVIFTLADDAFGYACNSHNQRSVATNCSVDYLAPALSGDVLSAECTEQGRVGRTWVYDVRVTNGAGALVALFRGKSMTVKGHWVDSHGEK